jgi:ubiquinone/menaquinone biosynthesis C-methylase UbiE
MSELVQKVWAKTLLWSGRNAIVGAVEHPTDDHAYAAWIDVRGWALSLDAQSPVTVDLLVGDRVVQRVTPSVPRPEIGALFPETAGSGTCGFDARLTIAVLPWQGESTLTVKAISEAPRRGEAILGTIRIRRQSTTAARANYGQVWDDADVSGSATNARISVAGNADLEEYARSGDATAGDIVEHAHVTTNDTVLEIGCGTGRIGVKLAPRCGHWIGADVSQNMLRHARETLRDCANVSFVHLNGIDLAGVDDRSIDVVYCSGVFMHLDEWDRFRYVMEARRVLKPGGRVYFDNFNLRSDEGWQLFEDLYRLEPAARPPNISRSSTPEELRTYAERAGYQDIVVLTRALWVTVIARKPA